MSQCRRAGESCHTCEGRVKMLTVGGGTIRAFQGYRPRLQANQPQEWLLQLVFGWRAPRAA